MRVLAKVDSERGSASRRVRFAARDLGCPWAARRAAASLLLSYSSRKGRLLMKGHHGSGISLIGTFTKLAELGAEWVMWLLLALAALCVVVSVERLYLFISTRLDVTATARKLLLSLE